MTNKKVASCKARRVNDQMQCGHCGMQWDYREERPGPCSIEQHGHKALADIRNHLAEVDRPRFGLLELPETPFQELPAFGHTARLLLTKWRSLPELSYVVLIKEDAPNDPKTRYMFFGDFGTPLVEVLRSMSQAGSETMIKFHDDVLAAKWKARLI